MSDPLTHAERIRLEALSQAQNMAVMVSTTRPSIVSIFQAAERIEAWLRQAKENS